MSTPLKFRSDCLINIAFKQIYRTILIGDMEYVLAIEEKRRREYSNLFLTQCNFMRILSNLNREGTGFMLIQNIYDKAVSFNLLR